MEGQRKRENTSWLHGAAAPPRAIWEAQECVYTYFDKSETLFKEDH